MCGDSETRMEQYNVMIRLFFIVTFVHNLRFAFIGVRGLHFDHCISAMKATVFNGTKLIRISCCHGVSNGR